MKTQIITILSLFLSINAFSQNNEFIDFENLKGKKPGDLISYIKIPEKGYIRFFSGYDLKDTAGLRLQKVGVDADDVEYGKGGFQGIRNNKDCEENTISMGRMNQINYNYYPLSNELTNRERAGCQFVSLLLEGQNMPSVFIEYTTPSTACSGDIIDIDGINNAIEAYDIYYYAKKSDYPNRPINKEPILVKNTRSQFGKGEIGDDGGLTPFKIESGIPFVLIELRPNQQLYKENTYRTIFGFALDNFSPYSIEEAPYKPPFLLGNDVVFETEKPDKSEQPVIEDQFPEEVIEAPII